MLRETNSGENFTMPDEPNRHICHYANWPNRHYAEKGTGAVVTQTRLETIEHESKPLKLLTQ